MTVVQPNSIAGINSISVQSGQSLSIHKSDGTLIREIVASTGISTFSSISVGSAATANNAGKSINIGLGASISQHADNTLSFGTNGIVRARIDSSGRLLVNKTSGSFGLEVGAGSDSTFRITNVLESSHGSHDAKIVAGGSYYQNPNIIGSAIKFSTYNGSAEGERARFDSAGKLGIGTAAPGQTLHLSAASGDVYNRVDTNVNGGMLLYFQGTQRSVFANDSAFSGTSTDTGIGAKGNLIFRTGTSSYDERLRIDTDGRLLIGSAANSHNGGDLLQLSATSSTASIQLNRYTANAHPSYLNFFKSRNASISGQTVVQDDDTLGMLAFYGSDGTDRALGAEVCAQVDGTPGSDDMPSRLVFRTSADGSQSPTERLRITSAGKVLIGTATPQGNTNADDLVVSTSGHSGISIRSGTTHHGNIFFADGTTSTAEYSGWITYQHDNLKLTFGTNANERVIIDSNGNTNITGVTTSTGFYPSSAQTGRRNMFINGNMSIAQRSTSSSTNGFYTLDRFFTHWSGGAGTISQETLSPGDELEGSSHYLRMTVTTASDYTVMRCPLEDVRRFSGDITVSFWAKYVTNAPNGGLACWFQTNYGSGGTANGSTAQQVFNGSGLPSLTTSWVKYSVTFSDFPALSGKTIGAGNYAEFLFGQGATAGSTAFTLDITNIQVEKGKSSSAFEQIGHQENLANCQRYYYKESIANNDFYSGMGMADVDGNSVILNLPFPVTMRQEPSLDTTGAATDYMIRRSTTAQCTSVPTIGGASTKHMAAVVFTKSSHGFGDGSAVRCGAWGNSYLGFDAELSI